MKDKLAEEILFGYRLKAGGMTEADMIEAMQAYHEAANKQITDEDIDMHIIEHYVLRSVPFCLAFTNGAKAFRNGEIKHIKS